MSEENFANIIGSQKLENPRSTYGANPSGTPVGAGAEDLIVKGEEAGWAKLKDNAYISVSISERALPKGCYRAVQTNIGMSLQHIPILHDNLLMLADSKSKSVVEEIKKFSTMKERFNRYGLLHKRGILLWGPPGGGKTCTVQLILQLIIEQGDGLGVQIEHPNEAVTALRIIRNIEPKRQIVAVLEDIDALVDRYGEAEYLSLLDGETQTDNIVYVATTNYPERLDRRFVDRPSRFDTIVWVGMPSLAARREYLLSKDPSWDKKELEYILHGTEGYSIAHLREIFILIKCFEYPMKEAVEKVSKMKNAKPSSEDSPDKKKVGFA